MPSVQERAALGDFPQAQGYNSPSSNRSEGRSNPARGHKGWRIPEVWRSEAKAEVMLRQFRYLHRSSLAYWSRARLSVRLLPPGENTALTIFPQSQSLTLSFLNA